MYKANKDKKWRKKKKSYTIVSEDACSGDQKSESCPHKMPLN